MIADLSHYVRSCGAYLARRGGPPLRTRLAVIADYTRLTLIERSGSGRRSVRLLGCTVEFSDAFALRQVFEEIVIGDHYALNPAGRDDPLILDGGANIGFATVYFKWLYPNATIHCFEPNPSSFALLRTNVGTNELRDVHLHEVALGGADGTMPLVGAGLSTTVDAVASRSVTPSSETEGAVARVERLSPHLQSLGAVDILKLDIEGAEVDVLVESKEHLELCRQITLEFHRWAGSPSASVVMDTLDEAGHEYEISHWNSLQDATTCMIRSTFRG